MNVTTDVATEPPARRKPPTIRERIEGADFRAAVAQVLPRHLTADRFVRVAILALTRTPALAECDQASLFGALMRLSQLGLEPDGYRAHLIPFRNEKRGIVECQLIIDYKGLAELVMRSGTVSFLHADVVCENDRFDFNLGEIIEHRINLKEDRGSPYAVYCRVRFKDESVRAEVMSKTDVERIRRRSFSPNKGPWVTDWNEMAKKTVFRRLSKWLPLSPEIRDAAEADMEAYEDHKAANARPVFDAVPGIKAESFLPPLPPEPQIDSEVAASGEPAHLDRAQGDDPGNPLRSRSPGPPPPSEQRAVPTSTPQAQIAELVTELGYTFDDLKHCSEVNSWPCDLAACGGFVDLTPKETTFLLRNKAGLAVALKSFKAAK
jgi:recombination protein RecT